MEVRLAPGLEKGTMIFQNYLETHKTPHASSLSGVPCSLFSPVIVPMRPCCIPRMSYGIVRAEKLCPNHWTPSSVLSAQRILYEMTDPLSHSLNNNSEEWLQDRLKGALDQVTGLHFVPFLPWALLHSLPIS